MRDVEVVSERHDGDGLDGIELAVVHPVFENSGGRLLRCDVMLERHLH